MKSTRVPVVLCCWILLGTFQAGRAAEPASKATKYLESVRAFADTGSFDR